MTGRPARTHDGPSTLRSTVTDLMKKYMDQQNTVPVIEICKKCLENRPRQVGVYVSSRSGPTGEVWTNLPDALFLDKTSRITGDQRVWVMDWEHYDATQGRQLTQTVRTTE